MKGGSQARATWQVSRVFCGGQGWAGCPEQEPFLHILHSLEQVTPKLSPDASTSLKNVKDAKSCGRPDSPSARLSLADIAHQSLPSSPASFFS